MATKTIFVDSRTRIRGSHADFSVSLLEGITLRGARLFVDAIRTTDTFPTISERNRYAYFRGASNSLWVYTLTPGAYTGTSFAAELAAVSGRACSYNSGRNSLQLTNTANTSLMERRGAQRVPGQRLSRRRDPTGPPEHQRHIGRGRNGRGQCGHISICDHGSFAGSVFDVSPAHGARQLHASRAEARARQA